MSGGAWPFLVGGVICLVDSDNERDHERVVGGIKKFFGRGVKWVKFLKRSWFRLTHFE